LRTQKLRSGSQWVPILTQRSLIVVYADFLRMGLSKRTALKKVPNDASGFNLEKNNVRPSS
jgi:hypothetical protein